MKGGTRLLYVYPNLAKLMEERDMGYEDIADLLEISKYAAYRRLRGLSGWKLHETIRLCHFFDDSDAAWLFELCVTVTQKT